MQRKQEPKRCCRSCGCQMTRKRYGTRLEDLSVFLRRRFCSLSCANTRQDKTKDGWRRIARLHAKTACEVCSSTLKLHVHHCNHNIKDNSPENLQTLCASCHAKHHHYSRRLGKVVSGRMTQQGLL